MEFAQNYAVEFLLLSISGRSEGKPLQRQPEETRCLEEENSVPSPDAP
jgi:hypothetical protein